jgi:Fanconi-associated nuclease 1
MILKAQSNTDHNAMVGRRIQHPSSTNFNDDKSPPAKRLKTLDSTDGDDSRDVSEDETSFQIPNPYRDEIPDSEDDGDSHDDQSKPTRPTELESALPPIKTDKEAIAEYEAMRAAEQDVPGDLEDRLKDRRWTKGKSSIYVDAFNLALETVLEDEGHLFDEKELEVFNQWRELDYEAQYLYVRPIFRRSLRPCNGCQLLRVS